MTCGEESVKHKLNSGDVSVPKWSISSKTHEFRNTKLGLQRNNVIFPLFALGTGTIIAELA